MNYAKIKYSDIANGNGVRTCLFVSGCTHHCKGCFNAEAFDFNYGSPFTTEVQEAILTSIEPSYIAGLSLLGGEPLEPVNQRGLVDFLEEFKTRFPEKTIWCYSGYTYDRDIVAGGRAHTEVTDRILNVVDVMVDGKFEQENYDIGLRFRGSSNQRIIDVPKTLRLGEVVMWEDEVIYANRHTNALS